MGRVVLLVLALLLAGIPAAADEPEARAIDRVCPAPAAFTDAGDPVSYPDLGTTHAEAITCATEYGTVSGFGDGTFRPAQPITRGQMATFVSAWLRTATGIPLAVPIEGRFSDVEGNIHADAIEALAAAEIVGGREDGTFGPMETLTRGQFTRAVANAISYADVFAVDGPLPPADDRVEFTDVAGTTFESTILSLAGIGVALGAADGGFQPQLSVTRGQLATFLMRSADYLDRYQRWRPTAETRVVLVADLESVVAPDDGTAAPPSDPEAPTDPADPTAAPGDDPLPTQASVTLTINAFNGTMAYSLDVSEAPGPYADPGASLHVGDVRQGGPLVLELADLATLDAASDGVAIGVVREADSRLRFADLALSPGDAYVQLATEAGDLRGVLRVLPD